MGIRNAEREYAMVNGNTQCRTRIRYGKWEYAMPNANTLWENANQKVTFSATIRLTSGRSLARTCYLAITNSYLPRDFECIQVRNVIDDAIMLPERTYGNFAMCHQALFRVPREGLGTRLDWTDDIRPHTFLV